VRTQARSQTENTNAPILFKLRDVPSYKQAGMGRVQGEGGAMCGEHLEHPAVAKISLAHVAGDSVMEVAGGTKTELNNVFKNF
jgi:hypothetical protein